MTVAIKTNNHQWKDLLQLSFDP